MKLAMVKSIVFYCWRTIFDDAICLHWSIQGSTGRTVGLPGPRDPVRSVERNSGTGPDMDQDNFEIHGTDPTRTKKFSRPGNQGKCFVGQWIPGSIVVFRDEISKTWTRTKVWSRSFGVIRSRYPLLLIRVRGGPSTSYIVRGALFNIANLWSPLWRI